MRIALVAGLVAAAALMAGLALRRPEAKAEARRAPVKVEAPPAAPVVVVKVTPRQALDVALKVFAAGPATEVTREEIFALIREAGAAHAARDVARLDAAMAKLTAHGAAIQRWLAEAVLTFADESESYVAAVALAEVATPECAPFALALVRTDRPACVRALAVTLLTKFKSAEAAPVLEGLLFGEDDAHVKALAVDYFVATGGVKVLAAAAGEESLAELRRRAATGLARIGTPEAGTALLETWKALFDGSSGRAAMSNYFLLEALAGFEPSFLRGLFEEALRSESNASRLNVMLSMLAKTDRGLAIEQVKSVLAGGHPKSVRGQALLVLGAMGGREAQELLLELLGSPREARDFLDCANGLLGQDRLEVAFERVTGLYGSATDPLARAVLAALLAKYPERLAQDRAFAMSLLEDATREAEGRDPARRALGLQVSAALADYTADPAGHLASLYGRLKGEERDGNAAVFAELAKRGGDERVRPVLESALADEGAAAHRRAVAADALLGGGSREPVYAALEKTKDPQAAALLSGLLLSREGAEGAKRLSEIAKATSDESKRRMLEEQVKAFGRDHP